jgi:glycosyltransferase involved in cell wall biosynthesis
VALLRDRTPQRKIRLFLTCTLDDAKTPGAYKTGAAARLIRELRLEQEIVQLGAVPYRLLHHLYRACDVYVTAAYAETFAHPLVEAMACGLPIIASDLSAHREVCGESASYFPPFSAEALADQLLATATVRKSPDLQQVPRFSWSNHVQAILGIAATLVAARTKSSDALAGSDSMARSSTDCLPDKPAAAARH